MTERANILLVDDRRDKHVVYRAILDELGQNLVSAMSGEQALKEVLKDDFAVILLDVNMPGMDGLETAALIRGRGRSAHVPIIFITADYGDEVRTARGYSLGAVDFMVSPIVPQILRTKVKVFVDLYLLAQQARRQAGERAALASERIARAAAERANQRSAFLARASGALSGSLHHAATARELVRVAIPFLADVAALTISPGEDIEPETSIAWIEPGAAPRIESFREIGTDWWRQAVERVMETRAGEAFGVSGSADSGLGAGETVPAEPVESPAGFALTSLIVLPLVARGRTLGVLSLGLGSAERSFDPELLSLASDLAGRGAIALDNAMLYKEMRDQDRRKNEFLAMLSHELRNPLAPIMNALHVLNSGERDAAKVGWAKEVLERQVNQLRRLVDDLLDVSRITHGKIELRVEAVGAADVVAVAVETVRPIVDAQAHTLTLDVSAEPMRIMGDRARLAQILSNLLNNAAKYTPRGGSISLTLRREGEQAVYSVRDSGIGIPQDGQATIFEPFRQLGPASDRPQGGLGVGLTLVKRLVDMHGGTIEARSEGRAKGSEFVVRLPLSTQAEDERTQEEAMEEEPQAPVRKKRRILVADDNVDLAASMGLLLEMMGNDVRVTHDGAAAVSAETEFRPDVVFLDIGMAKMDGFDACRHIRSQPWGKEPVIVALTGWGQAEDKRRSQEAGFDHHLVKPIEPSVLERFLAQIEAQAA